MQLPHQPHHQKQQHFLYQHQQLHPSPLEQEKQQHLPSNNTPSQQPDNPSKTPKSKRNHKLSEKSNPQSLSPTKNKQRKGSKYLNDKQKNPNQLFGHWNQQQNKKYHWFLQVHNSHFMNRSLRRMDKIFTTMAKFIGSREAEQCRSHHQKMEKKYKTFAKILLSLRNIHYETSSEQMLKKDMQQNKIEILEPLLIEQSLLKHSNNPIDPSTPRTPYSTISSPEKSSIFIEPYVTDMKRLDFEQDEPLPMDQQYQQQQHQPQQQQPYYQPILNPDMWHLQLQSSKNYFFKLQLQNPINHEQNNNLLDQQYEDKLDFNNTPF